MRRGLPLARRTALLLALLLPWAPAPRSSRAQDASSADSLLGSWWNGPGFVSALPPAAALRERGVRLSGHYYGALFGIQKSESGAARPWDQGAQMNLDLEPKRILSVDELDGLVLTAQGRWREEDVDRDPNTFVQGSSMFDPSNWASGTGWRLLQANATFTSSLGSGTPDRLWVKSGWVQPRYEFALQPMSDRILNNAVNSAKGIGGNVPFSSSFSTWGAMGRLRSERLYAKAGLFMAYPDATASGNHGVRFSGEPSRNRVMSMAEIGFTPAAIDGRPLPGKYVVGGYTYDDASDAASAAGSANFGLQGGVYLQADQLVLRDVGDRHRDDGHAPQGLTTFNLLMLAPAHNNELQLYFHTGLDYAGPIPGRDRDAAIVALAYGNYSRSTKTETIFVEGGYHVALGGWVDLYPFLQYAVRPAGTRDVANAFIVGVGTNVVF